MVEIGLDETGMERRSSAVEGRADGKLSWTSLDLV